jgi:hypothetical protein
LLSQLGGPNHGRPRRSNKCSRSWARSDGYRWKKLYTDLNYEQMQDALSFFRAR